MAKFIDKLSKSMPKISYKYLLFILIISVGCLYQVIQVTLVYIQFETKIDFSIDKNDLTIPMISFCRNSSYEFKDKKRDTYWLTPAQVDNMTFGFGDIFLFMEYYDYDELYKAYQTKQISNLRKHEQSQNISTLKTIHFEKLITGNSICYIFKHPLIKLIKPKWPKGERTIYKFFVYNHEYNKSGFGELYELILSAKNDYHNRDYNHYKISRNNFNIFYLFLILVGYQQILIFLINSWAKL